MVFRLAGRPLERVEDYPDPVAGRGQVRVRVSACGVCRTDLHLVDGELPDPKVPVVPGHQIVGVIDQVGGGVTGLRLGDRVGIPWLSYSCGTCRYCRDGQENLCGAAEFTGYTLDGGYAEFAVADARYAFHLPPEERFPDLQAAPLLCAGLIGYRALRMCGEGARRIGIYGFGAAAHILAQVIRYRGGQVYGFTRPGDTAAQDFARALGCTWCGGSDEPPPDELDAAIVFAPVGALVPRALNAVRRGGRVVCGGIHMSDIPSFPYRDLWEERSVQSVANLTRRDAQEFLTLAPEADIRTEVTIFPLGEANAALKALRGGAFTGAAVLAVGATPTGG
jgi:propanol-preferring alcohol dehydrogenase